MNEAEHRRLITELGKILDQQEWERLSEALAPDAVMEFPQSGERFSGVAKIRDQFENYPDLEPGSTQMSEIIGGTTYALTPMYTVVAVQGSGDRGTAIFRVRYPDGSMWWTINLYEVADGRVSRFRAFFAPDFEAPEWRAPYRDPS